MSAAEARPTLRHLWVSRIKTELLDGVRQCLVAARFGQNWMKGSCTEPLGQARRQSAVHHCAYCNPVSGWNETNDPATPVKSSQYILFITYTAIHLTAKTQKQVKITSEQRQKHLNR